MWISWIFGVKQSLRRDTYNGDEHGIITWCIGEEVRDILFFYSIRWYYLEVGVKLHLYFVFDIFFVARCYES